MNNKKFKWLWVVLPIVAVAGLGALFVNLGMDWFNALTKPSQWIPNWVIPVVWSLIYVAFAVVLVLWQRKKQFSKCTKGLLIANGVLNVLWCLVFFTLKLTFLGNIVIILNLIAGYLLLIDIFLHNKLYGAVLSIYPIWLSVATTLNLAMWILN